MTYLSPDAMREARKFMASDQSGVRDEIGFLTVHQRYSDRFFPGTSVLHTRLRYVLFVPWIYRDEQMRPSRAQRTQESIRAREHELTGRLLGEAIGVIGKSNYPDPVEQQPSQVYWGALRRWGILRELEGTGALSRHQVERMVSAKRSNQLKDEDGVALSAAEWAFTCPEPPEEWKKVGGPLKFRLLAPEKKFLAKRLRSLSSTENPGEKSILARLVGKDVSSIARAWSPQVQEIAGEEREALIRSGHAAALAAIGRAVYAAQVEALRDGHDHLPTSDSQRRALPAVLRKWRGPASRLDWDGFVEDMRTRDMKDLPVVVSDALRRTLEWVRSGKSDPLALEQVYREAEEHRKGRRARLSLTQSGTDRRTEWDNERHPAAEPLHYRWDRVKMLLGDLVGA